MARLALLAALLASACLMPLGFAMVCQVLDIDDSGGITFEEMSQGLRNIQTEPPMNLTADDWSIITDYGKVGLTLAC
jgi:hypothetical protein